VKHQSALRWLLPLIGILALFAAGMGLFEQTPGHPYPLTSFRGETVMINGHGLYYYDTVSTAAQMQANDLITLVVGLPLLVVSAYLAFRGSLRGQLEIAWDSRKTAQLGTRLSSAMSLPDSSAQTRESSICVPILSHSFRSGAISGTTRHARQLMPRSSASGRA
jgi:hypothetical protein